MSTATTSAAASKQTSAAASTSTAAGADAPATAKRSGKRRLILLVGLVVLLAGGGFAAWQLLAPAAPVKAHAAEPGAVVTLAPITLNLSDGRYLKVSLALQMTKDAAAVPAADSGASDTGAAAAPDGAKALDAAIAVLGQRSYRQLLAPGGRASAQKALSSEVSKRYRGEVMKVYFTEFLMQ